VGGRTLGIPARRRDDTEVRAEEAVIESTATVGVLIVDDQAPFRDVARTVVALSPGFDVVAEAASGEEAITAADDRHPQLVLMDINLPGINGLDATRRIVDAHPETIVILLSTYTRDDLPGDARSCGAVRYVHKEDFSPLILRETWDEHGPATNAPA
jgi:two-component system, NarL family, invasion response regulator UvrY